MSLEKLRRHIAHHGLGYYIVPTSDAHNSEYVSDHDKRREFISEFTGSSGTAVIGADQYAELATDGRYWRQAESQLPNGWSLRLETAPRVIDWKTAIAARSVAENVAVGVDPQLLSYADAQLITNLGAKLVPIHQNLVDLVWENRPIKQTNDVYALASEFTGREANVKIADLRHSLRTCRADAIVLSALDDIAWLLNLRGSDILHNPVFFAFLLVDFGKVRLYIETCNRKIADLSQSGVELRPYAQIYADVASLAQKDQRIIVPVGASWALAQAAGSKAILHRSSPVQLAKSRKNSVEIDGARRAQKLCGKSVVELFSWLQTKLRNNERLTEHDAALHLLSLRQQLPGFVGLSFPTISSSGPSASMIHYQPAAEGSRFLALNEVYLLDSGSHFWFGTTDTTRTVWFGNEKPPSTIVEAYTLVLKGHIALATAIFPEGTLGSKLDLLARQFLWKRGLNYAHGTGHGVGSFLNVHEGPVSIAMQSRESVCEGNLLSNEPGFYSDGEFGVRIESLITAQRARLPNAAANHMFLQFETITKVPFDRNLIDVGLLTPEETEWIDAYHSACRKTLADQLSDGAREYLWFHTEPLSVNNH